MVRARTSGQAVVAPPVPAQSGFGVLPDRPPPASRCGRQATAARPDIASVDLVPAAAERRTLVRRSAQLVGAAARTPAFAELTAVDRNPHSVAAGLPVASVPAGSGLPRRTDRGQRERASSHRNPADGPRAPKSNQ